MSFDYFIFFYIVLFCLETADIALSHVRLFYSSPVWDVIQFQKGVKRRSLWKINNPEQASNAGRE